MTFKVGDRVKAYGYVGEMGAFTLTSTRLANAASVVDIQVSGNLVLQVGDSQRKYVAHPKQCRRLVKRERRRVWIKSSAVNHALDPKTTVYQSTVVRADSPIPSLYGDKEIWVEFIEVRKKAK